MFLINPLLLHAAGGGGDLDLMRGAARSFQRVPREPY